MLRDPSQSEAGTFKKILVAVDGSEPARRAICTAVRLAKCLNAGCSIVHVVDTSPVTSPEMISTFVFQRIRHKIAAVYPWVMV